MLLLSLLAIFTGSFLLTEWYRRVALRKLLLDIPNERSSHNVPTPRGGGIAIVVLYLLSLTLLQSSLGLSMGQLSGFAIPGCLLAVISYIDDLNHVQPIWRLIVQITAAALGIYWLGGVPDIVAELAPAFQLMIVCGAVILLVWLVNL